MPDLSAGSRTSYARMSLHRVVRKRSLRGHVDTSWRTTLGQQFGVAIDMLESALAAERQQHLRPGSAYPAEVDPRHVEVLGPG